VKQGFVPRGGKMAKKVVKNQEEGKALEEEIIEDNLVKEEVRAQKKSEVDELNFPEENISGQEVDLVDVEEETQTEEEIAPEVSAIHEDTDTAQEAEKELKPEKKLKTAKKSEKERNTSKKPKKRSKKYLNSVEKIDKNKIYPVGEAIERVKETSYSKFDGTVNLAIRLEKNKKSEDAVRGTVKLVHGTGKSLKVVIASEDLIEKIKKGKVEFDILVASPDMMPKLAQVAKILGPKGKMPNPKDGTVVDDPKAALEDLGGKVVRYRADNGGNIHFPVGKVSWDKEKIDENIKTILKALVRFKINSATLSATMGPGVKIESK